MAERDPDRNEIHLVHGQADLVQDLLHFKADPRLSVQTSTQLLLHHRSHLPARSFFSGFILVGGRSIDFLARVEYK